MTRNLIQKRMTRRTRWSLPLLALVLTLAIAALAFTAQADQGQKEGGKGGKFGRHHGPGAGMGPGMAPGMGFMPALLAKLPEDKREQVRKIQLDLKRAMIDKGASMKNLGLDMRELMRAYPLDQATVIAKMEAMQKVRGEMFALRISAMAKAQQVAGQSLWKEALAARGRGFGHGRRGPPGHGRERRPGAHGQPGRMAPPPGHDGRGEPPKQ